MNLQEYKGKTREEKTRQDKGMCLMSYGFLWNCKGAARDVSVLHRPRKYMR